ncbi:MAG: hypothetical protein ACKVX9_08415 [Blastocatellia bacterium]
MKNRILGAAVALCCATALMWDGAPALFARTPQTHQPAAPQAKETANAPAKPPTIDVKPEFRGIRLDMPRAEVSQMLGEPQRKAGQMDEFKLDGGDLLTVRFNPQGKVRVIQFYCTDAKRAPAWADVVGDAQLQTKPNGSKYARKVVSAEKFWVSMFQTKTGTLTTLTISRQTN